ncbi:MAG: transposase, partial [Fusobacteriaceae bacterium]
WSASYCILSTGGATIETIKKYIEMQGEEEE